MVQGVGSVIRIHIAMVVPVRRASYDAIIEDMDGRIGNRVEDYDARGTDRDSEEPLCDEEAQIHRQVVDGFHQELQAPVDFLVVLMMEEHMGIQIGDRTGCGK